MISEQQHGLMLRKRSIDVMFTLRVLMKKYRNGQTGHH